MCSANPSGRARDAEKPAELKFFSLCSSARDLALSRRSDNLKTTSANAINPEILSECAIRTNWRIPLDKAAVASHKICFTSSREAKDMVHGTCMEPGAETHIFKHGLTPCSDNYQV